MFRPARYIDRLNGRVEQAGLLVAEEVACAVIGREYVYRGNRLCLAVLARSHRVLLLLLL